MTETSQNIPQPQAAEIRRMAHDLSNALEVVVQASYLLSNTPIEGDAKEWLKLLDQGVRNATEINRNLREYIRANS